MQEFRFSKGTLISLVVLFSFFISICLGVIIYPLILNFHNSIEFETYKYLVPFLILVVLFLLLAIYDLIKYKVIIDHEKIALQSFFSNREIYLHEIKGYRETEKKTLKIESKNEYQKNIETSQYFTNQEIKYWLIENNYPNLDDLKFEQESASILKNDSFGANENERELNLQKAKSVSKAINIIGVLISIWILFYPNPYKYAIVCGILFPILSLFIYKYFNGLIKIGEAKKSPFPSIYISLILVTFSLILRQIFDFKLVDYSLPINYSILGSFVLLGIIFFKNEEFSFTSLKYLSSILSVSIMTFLFCYSSIILVNCSFDKSNPDIFFPKVLNKNISKGKHTSYNIRLSPWGPIKKEEEESISKIEYEQMKINDSVEIYLMNGKYEISWYEIFVK
ncbi:MAG: hypothetical protein KA275_04165 [Chitinophagaceae bacterium]|nr:hypothetical protein [Chitinophagaceae bacterium]